MRTVGPDETYPCSSSLSITPSLPVPIPLCTSPPLPSPPPSLSLHVSFPPSPDSLNSFLPPHRPPQHARLFASLPHIAPLPLSGSAWYCY